jgi:hypothetical protein
MKYTVGWFPTTPFHPHLPTMDPSPQCVQTSAMSLAPLISVISEVREGYEKFNPKKLTPFYT